MPSEDQPLDSFQIALRNAKVVSFDVFDTLVVRPFLKPADLFAFIAPEVEKIIGQAINFRAERVAAEYHTRIALPEAQDITIHEIYDYFSAIPKHHREAVKQLELERERQLIYAKKSGQELYTVAKASGRRLVAISDMYLDEDFIRDILLNLGYEFEEVYVSSKRREVKYNSSMFQYVLNDLQISSTELFHVGDSDGYDIQPAKRLGIRTLRVQKNSETFLGNRENALLWSNKLPEDPSLSALLGVVANKLFDKNTKGFSYDQQSLFNGDPYALGYYWLGPLLVSFCIQLIRDSRDKKYLYFLSRDGWIIKQIYDIVAPYFDYAPESRYLYVSRKSTALAPIHSLDNMREKFGVVWFETTVGEWIKDRIGIPTEPGDDQLVRRCGFKDGLESKINLKNCYKFQGVLSVISPRILAKAKKERELLFSYLSQEGIARPNAQGGNTDYKIGFVDIGYHGQTPRNIFQLTNNYNIDLYFLVAGKDIFGLVDEFGINFYGSYGEKYRNTRVLNREWKKFFRHHKVFETFFITQEGSVNGYARDFQGKVVPRFYETQFGREQEITKQVHVGAVDFTTEFSKIFGYAITKVNAPSNVLMEPILLFANYTSPRDVGILEGAFFEDYFSGLALRKVEWFAGNLAKRYSGLACFRNRIHFRLRKLYDIPSIGVFYDFSYEIALKGYRRARRMMRSIFVFKNFFPHVF
ncbi:MAG: HAD-IA family hydrolase [Patescibacteria group bacterium]